MSCTTNILTGSGVSGGGDGDFADLPGIPTLWFPPHATTTATTYLPPFLLLSEGNSLCRAAVSLLPKRATRGAKVSYIAIAAAAAAVSPHKSTNCTLCCSIIITIPSYAVAINFLVVVVAGAGRRKRGRGRLVRLSELIYAAVLVLWQCCLSDCLPGWQFTTTTTTTTTGNCLSLFFHVHCRWTWK